MSDSAGDKLEAKDAHLREPSAVSGFAFALFLGVVWLLASLSLIVQTYQWPAGYTGPWDYDIHPEQPDDSYFVQGRIVTPAMLLLTIIYLILAVLIYTRTRRRSDDPRRYSGRFAFVLWAVLASLLYSLSCVALQWWFWSYTD